MHERVYVLHPREGLDISGYAPGPAPPPSRGAPLRPTMSKQTLAPWFDTIFMVPTYLPVIGPRHIHLEGGRTPQLGPVQEMCQ